MNKSYYYIFIFVYLSINYICTLYQKFTRNNKKILQNKTVIE